MITRSKQVVFLAFAVILSWQLPREIHAQQVPLLSRSEFVGLVTRLALARAARDTESVRSVASRARWAGLLPHLSVRVVRGSGATDSIANTGVDNGIYHDTFLVDVRASWRLDRLVFDPTETRLMNIEINRLEYRHKLELEVIETITALDRARLTVARSQPGSVERSQSEIETARRTMELETLTGSSFAELLRASSVVIQ